MSEKPIKGGEFLIRDTQASDIFIPENWTEEQRMIQSMVRDLARTEFAPKAMERDKTKEFPADNLKKLGELGLLRMMVPPEYGGSAADSVS